VVWATVGARMNPPSGHVTFLFTDIERSSHLWEMHPQAMGRSLSVHDELMRAVFEEHRGHVFKTIGDAFCVAFNYALDAAEAAVEAQRQLLAATWEETGPLKVRMALHSGEAQERDGDYFGQTLNRVARILATGHGGQTLLSHVTAENVNDALPREITLRDLGERRLKDLSKPERIFQIVTKDLPSEFPPLRSLEVMPNNLPAQVTTFVGRTREMAELKRIVGTTRLVTLTGPGGTGKTRLSLQVAAEVLDRYPHGVWLIELATVSDRDALLEMVANTVDVRLETGRPPLETLVHALQSRGMLLVLDNCEHLVAHCAELATVLLQRCPQLSILASSREPLRIAGEATWPVPSLAAPDLRSEEQKPSFETLAELESVQLFAERAMAARPDFVLTEANAALVAQICWRLDGIPLAIELAAARVKMLTLAQILARLDDRFHLLSGGSRTALPRQQTLGALIDWSYDLLSEPEKTLFRRLAVFVAGRTIEMAEEVCAGDGLERREIFELLSALVDKSLVTTETGPEGESRYTMLESLWDYADNKMAEQGETATYRDKHLDYFVKFAELAEPQLEGPDQQAWLEKLSAEHHNLNFALQWSLETPGGLERGLRLAGALERYWEVRSYLTEGREHYESLLTKADESIPPAVLAKAQANAGRLAWCQDHDKPAIGHFIAALENYEKLGMLQMQGYVNCFLGFTQRNLGNLALAREHFDRALTIAEKGRFQRVTATARSGLGSLAADEGNLLLGRQLKEESLATHRRAGDRWIVGLIAWTLGKVCVTLGDHGAARAYLRESLLTSRELGNKWAVPYALEAIADICLREDRATKAVQLYGAASTLREALALSFSPSERTAYDTALDALHAALKDGEFYIEWETGQALGVQAAINLAMDAPSSENRIRQR
jgi:predicted ATPase/class 3 adenylate cyclase